MGRADTWPPDAGCDCAANQLNGAGAEELDAKLKREAGAGAGECAMEDC